MSSNKQQIELENRLTKLEESLNEVRINHLPHIEDKLDKVIWALVGSPILTALVTALVIKFIVK